MQHCKQPVRGKFKTVAMLGNVSKKRLKYKSKINERERPKWARSANKKENGSGRMMGLMGAVGRI